MDCGSPFGHCACPKEIPLGDVFVRLRRTKTHLRPIKYFVSCTEGELPRRGKRSHPGVRPSAR